MRAPYGLSVAMGALWAVLAAMGAPARAETLYDALSDAYRLNPTLAASRDAVRSAAENVEQARVGERFTAGFTGTAQVSGSDTDTFGAKGSKSLSASLRGNLPIYDGGKTSANVAQAEANLAAAQARYGGLEQQTLLDTITAYLNVVRDREILGIALESFEVIRRQFEASKARFQAGEATLTDVAQANARLATLRATVFGARGSLTASEASFQKLVGRAPSQPQPPTRLPTLPASSAAAVDLAMSHPSVRAARLAERAATAAADSAMGGYLPEVDLNSALTVSKPNFISDDASTKSASFTLQITQPIIDGGATDSRVRQARAVASQRRLEIQDAENLARQNASSAFASFVASQQTLAANLNRVSAAQLAFRGVSEELTVGSRSMLDALNAQQDLLDARTALVRAARDSHVAAYTILAATGRLDPAVIGLSRGPEPVAATPGFNEIIGYAQDTALATINGWEFPWPRPGSLGGPVGVAPPPTALERAQGRAR